MFNFENLESGILTGGSIFVMLFYLKCNLSAAESISLYKFYSDLLVYLLSGVSEDKDDWEGVWLLLNLLTISRSVKALRTFNYAKLVMNES